MKHPLKNRIMGIAFMASIIICYCILVPPVQFWFWITRNYKNSAGVGSFFFRVQMKLLGTSPVATGLENIPKDRSFVVMANHQSFIDIGTLMHEIEPLAFLAKKELFGVPFFGNSLKFMGCIPIDRGSLRANAELPNTLHDRIAQGYNYCVFPEGTRSTDGKLLPFKNGMFKIIAQAPVTVLPVTLCHTGKILPKKGLALYPQHSRMIIHPAITPEQIAQWNPEQFRDTVRAQIESALM